MGQTSSFWDDGDYVRDPMYPDNQNMSIPTPITIPIPLPKKKQTVNNKKMVRLFGSEWNKNTANLLLETEMWGWR